MADELIEWEQKGPVRLSTGRVFRIRDKRPCSLACRVYGVDGKTPLKGCAVKAVPAGGGEARTAKTDEQGNVEFPDLPAGEVKLLFDPLLVHPLSGNLTVPVADRPPQPKAEVDVRTGEPVAVQAARVPVVFVHGILGSQLFLKHDQLHEEIWPNVYWLYKSNDNVFGPIATHWPGDWHLYLLALQDNAWFPDDIAGAKARLARLQAKALDTVYWNLSRGDPDTSKPWSIEVGDLVQDVLSSFPADLRRRAEQATGANLSDWSYAEMIRLLTERLGYTLYKRPGAPERVLAEHRKPPATPPAGGADEDLFFFCYDWRKDPEVLAGELKSFIDNVKAYTEREQVHLVSHSLGTLISRLYARENSASIDHLVTAGGPHLGSAETLGAVINGHRVDDQLDSLFKDSALRVLSCTLPSVYHLFPRWPRANGPQLRVRWNHDGVDEIREAHGAAAAGQVNSELKELVESALERYGMKEFRPNPELWTRADALFRDKLGTHLPPDAASKLIAIWDEHNAATNKTLYFELTDGFLWDTLEGVDTTAPNRNRRHLEQTSGDGTVPAFSAMPWQAGQLKRAFKTTRPTGHGALYNSTETADLLRDLFLGQPLEEQQ